MEEKSFKNNKKKKEKPASMPPGLQAMLEIIMNGHISNKNDDIAEETSLSKDKGRGRGRSCYNSRKVYVSNIPIDATYLELKKKFKAAGEVTFVQMLKNETNNFNGCAVITFKEAEMAKEAFISRMKPKFKGNKLLVQEEEANPEFKGVVGLKCSQNSFVPPTKSGEVHPKSKGISGRRSLLNDRDNCSISIPVAPPTMSNLVDYNNRSISIPVAPPTMSNLVNYNNHSISIPVSPPTMSNLVDYNNRSISIPYTPPSLSNLVDYETYGLSMTFLESLKIDLPLVNTVFVSNFDYSTDEAALKDVFNLAGKVVKCEVFKDKEGKSRGYGIVEFENPIEAVQAISMLHYQSYRERFLCVKMYRPKEKKEPMLQLPAGLKSIGKGLGIYGEPLKDVTILSAASPKMMLTSMNPRENINDVYLETANANSFGSHIVPGNCPMEVKPRIGLQGVYPAVGLKKTSPRCCLKEDKPGVGLIEVKPGSPLEVKPRVGLLGDNPVGLKDVKSAVGIMGVSPEVGPKKATHGAGLMEIKPVSRTGFKLKVGLLGVSPGVGLKETKPAVSLMEVNTNYGLLGVKPGVGLMGVSPGVGLMGVSPFEISGGLTASPGVGLPSRRVYTQNSNYGIRELENINEKHACSVGPGTKTKSEWRRSPPRRPLLQTPKWPQMPYMPSG